MSRVYTGTVIINLKEFWEWVTKNYMGGGNDNILYGVPKINSKEDTIEINFAASSEGDPGDWSSRPEALRQWDRVKSSYKKD